MAAQDETVDVHCSIKRTLRDRVDRVCKARHAPLRGNRSAALTEALERWCAHFEKEYGLDEPADET